MKSRRAGPIRLVVGSSFRLNEPRADSRSGRHFYSKELGTAIGMASATSSTGMFPEHQVATIGLQ